MKKEPQGERLTMFIGVHSLLTQGCNVIHIKHRKYRRFSVIQTNSAKIPDHKSCQFLLQRLTCRGCSSCSSSSVSFSSPVLFYPPPTFPLDRFQPFESSFTFAIGAADILSLSPSLSLFPSMFFYTFYRVCPFSSFIFGISVIAV